MALPKRKHSKSRTNKRRSQWKLKLVSTSLCPQCHEPRRPHYVCPHCGSYDGKKVVEVKAAD